MLQPPRRWDLAKRFGRPAAFRLPERTPEGYDECPNDRPAAQRHRREEGPRLGLVRAAPRPHHRRLRGDRGRPAARRPARRRTARPLRPPPPDPPPPYDHR